MPHGRTWCWLHIKSVWTSVHMAFTSHPTSQALEATGVHIRGQHNESYVDPLRAHLVKVVLHADTPAHLHTTNVLSTHATAPLCMACRFQFLVFVSPAETRVYALCCRPFNYWTFGAAVSEVELDTLTGKHACLPVTVIVSILLSASMHSRGCSSRQTAA